MKKATRNSYGEILEEIGKDENIFVVDADLSSSTKTGMFQKLYPERFVNVGIAEANMVGIASGIASTGKTVFASSFAIFLTGRAYDSIRQSVAYNNSNVKLVSTHAGLSASQDGATHQMIEDISLMRTMPNMRVFVPSDDKSTKAIIKLLVQDEKPAYVRLSRTETENIYDNINEDVFKLGSSYTHGMGRDFGIIACGETVSMALEAKERLKQEKIEVRVLDMYSIYPIDEENILKTARECDNIITIENHSIRGGLYSSVCEVLCKYYPKKVYKIGMNSFGKSGKDTDVFKYFKITSDALVKKIKDIIYD